MVNDYNCPIKEKSIRWQREYSIQFVEIERLSFRDFAELYIPLGYMPTLYLKAEEKFWMNLTS